MNGTMHRNPTADILKGLAVLCMVQVHLTELFALPSLAEHPAGKFSLFLGGPPAAPVFLAVMGYFLARSKRPDSRLFLRGLYLFAGGFLLNLGLNARLFYEIFTGASRANPFHYIFGVDILYSAGMSVTVITAMRRFLTKNALLPVALAFVAAALPAFLPASHTSGAAAYFEAMLYGKQAWSYFPLLPWLSYPLLGFAFALFEKHPVFPQLSGLRSRLPIVGAWIVFLIFTLSYGISIAADLPLYYHHGLAYFLWCFAFLVGYVSLVSLLSPFMPKSEALTYAAWLGKNVTSLYVFQWLIIGNTATVIFRSQNAFQLGLWFIGIMFAISVAAYLWQQGKQKFSGISAKGKA